MKSSILLSQLLPADRCAPSPGITGSTIVERVWKSFAAVLDNFKRPAVKRNRELQPGNCIGTKFTDPLHLPAPTILRLDFLSGEIVRQSITSEEGAAQRHLGNQMRRVAMRSAPTSVFGPPTSLLSSADRSLISFALAEKRIFIFSSPMLPLQ
ncbi:unnamed protein product [Nesidiocoris tenuis]|uniref:Uncharacterized protein n=1 Tax=Nesidiocoris tenuis TaxID=355587 RepID=A0A6H5HDX6_9HEMI|nr:unnamed protein product [Nesidiocoris tenuis]